MFTEDKNPGLAALAKFAAERAEFWKNPPRGECSEDKCPEENPILYVGEDGVRRCAHHHTRLGGVDRDRAYPCDNCGEAPAFRDPAHRVDEMLCPRCHERDGYVPGERSMITRVMKRVGVTHSKGTKAVCIAAGRGTDCKGQIKPRGKLGVLCDFHADPRKFNARRAP